MKKERINVLVIPTWYPNGTDKLMGIYHKEFCEALAKRDDVKVDMLYVDRQRLKEPFKYIFMKKNEVINENGYNTYIRKMLDIHKISYDLQIKCYVKTLKKLLIKYIKKNGKPDVLHAEVTIPAGYAACVLGKKYHIPVVITEHASYFERFFESDNKKYSDVCLNYAYFTAVSNYMKESLLKYCKKCEVIPNLVDTEIFKKNRKKVDGIKLITVAGLREGKRIDDIIKALKIIREKGFNATLTIVGDGFLENSYKRRCHELDMDDYVDFVGRKNKNEIADLLLLHNIYVISSEIETFCIPGIEALASGLPIVTTKCLGPEEYVDKRCGEIVPVDNDVEMANKIIKVYSNLEKYNIDYLRSVADNYSSNAVAEKAVTIYKKLMNREEN